MEWTISQIIAIIIGSIAAATILWFVIGKITMPTPTQTVPINIAPLFLAIEAKWIPQR